MRHRPVLLFLFALLSCLAAFADVPIPAEVAELVRRPDRVEFPGRLEIDKPVLMFHQQYVVLVKGTIPKRAVERGDVRHLHIVQRLQEPSGRWIEGANYNQFIVPRGMRGHAIEYNSAVYVRPGRYRLAVVIYDSELKKANIYHRQIVVSALNRDPFPELDEHLPIAEFPERFDGTKALWPVSLQTKRINVQTAQPTRLDIVLNVTLRSRAGWLYRQDAEQALAIGSILGRLRLDHGCVRVSVIDALRTKVIIDRQNADALDWKAVQNAVQNVDQNLVDARDLENQRRIAHFVQSFVQNLATEPQGCEPATTSLRPVVVVVSHGMVLPNGSKRAKFDPVKEGEFFYLHLGQGGGGWTDAVGQILSSDRTKKINFADSRKAREAMARIVKAISATGD